MAEHWPGRGGPAIDYISGPPSERWRHETPRGLVILGATGSIGCNALAVVEARPDFFRVLGLACARNVTHLATQAERHRPPFLAVLDEAAAAEALKSGKLHGLGTDVLSQEPPSPNNPLLSAPNTLITPHIAWATVKARQNIINLTAENIRRWQEGHPINVVNGVNGTAAQ